SPVISSVGIHRNRYRLSGPHATKLIFLEIRSYPDIVQRNDFHHLLADLYVLADLNRAIADDSIHGRDHLGVAEVQFSLIEIRFPAKNIRISGSGTRPRDFDLLWSSSGGAPTGFRLFELAAGLDDHLLGSVDVGTGCFHSGRAGLCSGECLIVLL